jgi:hypothetical protein
MKAVEEHGSVEKKRAESENILKHARKFSRKIGGRARHFRGQHQFFGAIRCGFRENSISFSLFLKKAEAIRHAFELGQPCFMTVWGLCLVPSAKNTTNFRKIFFLNINVLQAPCDICWIGFCESKTTFYLCHPSTAIVDGSSGK